MPHPIEAIAREAYAHGWARTAGPMTDRVRAGCQAAVAYAVEHADDPNVLEVTLKLGSLEGAWAHVFDRREQLIADYVDAVTKVWRRLTQPLDVDSMIRALREQAGLREVVDPQQKATATAAYLRLLHGILDDPDYPELPAAVTAALMAGAAEGHAVALAVAAEQQPHEADHGQIGFDFNLAFDHAYAALDAADFPPDAWIQRIIRGNANDVGHMLADLMADEAPYQDMVDAVRELTGSSNVRAVSMFIDQAMSQALNQGAVNLYSSEGVARYDVLTAGDARVCPRCQDIEANNPYPVAQQPLVPAHPRCRCAVASTTPLRSSLFAPYQSTGGQ